MDARTVGLVLALIGSVSANLCKLSDLKIWPKLREDLINGSWFEMRTYPFGEFRNYENRVLELTWTPTQPGFYVRETYRSPPEAPCSVVLNMVPQRIARGIYEYTLPNGQRARMYMVYSDDSGVLMTTVCTRWDNTYCYDPDTTQWYRKPFQRRNVVCPYPEKIKSTLGRLIGFDCVNPDRFRRSLHRPDACASVTNQPTALTQGNQQGRTSAGVALPQCSLNRIEVQAGYDERLVAGQWFEARWFWSDKLEEYGSYAYEVTPEASGLRVKILLRKPVGSSCKVEEDLVRARVGVGKYEYYSIEYGQNVQSYISFVDNKYMIEYICLDKRGDACYKSEVAVFTRTPCTIGYDCLDPDMIATILSNLNIDDCVDILKYRNTPHRQPSCLATTSQAVNPNYIYYGVNNIYGTYPYGINNIYGAYPYGINNIYGSYPAYGISNIYGTRATYGIDAELLRLRKEKEIAEKEMLIVQKEVMELEKEKLRLSRSGAGGVPK